MDILQNVMAISLVKAARRSVVIVPMTNNVITSTGPVWTVVSWDIRDNSVNKVTGCKQGYLECNQRNLVRNQCNIENVIKATSQINNQLIGQCCHFVGSIVCPLMMNALSQRYLAYRPNIVHKFRDTTFLWRINF